MFRSAWIFEVWRRCQKHIPRSGTDNFGDITAPAAGDRVSRLFDQLRPECVVRR